MPLKADCHSGTLTPFIAMRNFRMAFRRRPQLGLFGGGCYVRALRSLSEVTGAHAVVTLAMVGVPERGICGVSQQERIITNGNGIPRSDTTL